MGISTGAAVDRKHCAQNDLVDLTGVSWNRLTRSLASVDAHGSVRDGHYGRCRSIIASMDLALSLTKRA